MPWFQVDDRAAFHRKIVAAGNTAVGLWTRAGSWCAGELTDGFVPDHMVATMGTMTQAQRLVKVGLWHRDDARGGFQFHQFTEEGRNPTRENVLTRREIAKNKKRKQRERNDPESAESQVDDSRPGGTVAAVPGGVPGVVNDTTPHHTTPTSPNGDVTTSGAAAPSDFDRFWAAYPRRTGKGAAEKAWAKAAAKGADPQRLIDAATHFAAARQDQDPRFTPHPATWLNQRRWEDEDQPPLRLVSGGYEPYQNPTDLNAYHEGLL